MHTYLRRCYATLGATEAETSLLLTALNSPHPIHAANGYYTRNSSWWIQWRNEGGGARGGHLPPGAALWGRQIEVGMLRTKYEMSNVSGSGP